MHSPAARPARIALLASLLSLLALAPAGLLGAQTASDSGRQISVTISGDSVARVVPRQSPARAARAIVTRSGAATLLLMDTTIVLQLTDRGLDDVGKKVDSARTNVADSAGAGLLGRMIAGAVLGALRPMLDRGFEYRLRDLGDAQYTEGGRLVLRRHTGEEVFRNVDVNGRKVMDDFAPADARAFAAAVRAARARLR